MQENLVVRRPALCKHVAVYQPLTQQNPVVGKSLCKYAAVLFEYIHPSESCSQEAYTTLICVFQM